MQSIEIFFKNIKIAWKIRVQYLKAFIVSVSMQILSYFSQLLITCILMQNFGALKNWSSYEVVFLFSMQIMTYSIGAALAANTVNDLPNMIITGEIDELLILPVNSLGYLLSSKFNVGYIAHFTIALIMMVNSYIGTGYKLTIQQFLILLAFIISGGIITAAIMLIVTIPCLIFSGTKGWWDIFYIIRTYTNYPITIFNEVIQFLVTCLVPFAFVAYYPCRYLFGKVEGIFLTEKINIISPAIAFLLLVIVWWEWKLAIKKYSSVGT